ncbi:monooxygenase 2-like isoform X2 [Mangifera indica]|uniref:monooxygenase 2-like isoform X2 n=1 Tax=Mangifera indica TaxID=29780 RepID=UPI001CFB5D60|nr:monooxygenase 2-like isoform X2 [Mangifera indica]
MKMVEEEVVIVGAGIAGLATAVALQRLEIRALVLEKFPCLRASGSAITLFPNALLALDALGVAHKLTSLYDPTESGFVTNVETGATQETPFAGNTATGLGVGPRYVHRKTLLEVLAGELQTGSIRFSSHIDAIETQSLEGSTIPIIHLSDGTIIKSKILIGCDGVHSMVARWLGLGTPVNTGRSCVLGLSVFPDGHGLKQEVRQFVAVGRRAGFVPLNDKETYWFLNCIFSPKEIMRAEPEVIQRELLENYAKDFPEIYKDMIRHSDQSKLIWVPLTFRCPWGIAFGKLRKGNITVAGDAMHPMTPDLGHGGCAALEDAVVLGRHIGNSIIRNGGLVPGAIAEDLDGYVEERKWRVTWLAAGSYLSGWIQQGGSNWWMKILRNVFYNFLFPKLLSVIKHDCGKLPVVPFSSQVDPKKIE